MYILKVKGIAKIPDFVQVRDNSFTLIGYIKLDNLVSGLAKIGMQDKGMVIIEALKTNPFGKMIKI